MAHEVTVKKTSEGKTISWNESPPHNDVTELCYADKILKSEVHHRTIESATLLYY
jgi:hypothetical protein